MLLFHAYISFFSFFLDDSYAYMHDLHYWFTYYLPIPFPLILLRLCFGLIHGLNVANAFNMLFNRATQWFSENSEFELSEFTPM